MDSKEFGDYIVSQMLGEPEIIPTIQLRKTPLQKFDEVFGYIAPKVNPRTNKAVVEFDSVFDYKNK